MTHCNVPGAFTVGFVVTGEAFAGNDAWVYDQMSSTVEDGPERERGGKSILQSLLTAAQLFNF